MSRKQPPEPTLADVARHFVSADGADLYVGRTAADNDLLSLRLANGNDTWMHVAGVSGSHVIIRAAEGAAPSKETMLDAAHLAVHFSKARAASRGTVSCTTARHVGKTRGAPAGQVTLSQHRTMAVRVQPARLERLLERETPSSVEAAQKKDATKSAMHASSL